MENYRALKYVQEYKNYQNTQYKKKLQVQFIKNGYILPFQNNRGGVLDENKNFVELSFHNGEWFKVGGKYNFTNVNKRLIDKKVVFLGLFIPQWGHFLLDSLSRSWIRMHLNNIDDVVFAFISKYNSKIDGNYLMALNLLGIPSNKIMIIKEPIVAKEIIVPEMATTANHEFTRDYVDIFREIVNNANISDITVPKKVYLTRTHLKEAQKKEYGEKTIEGNFRLNGFKILDPQNLTLIQQIAIFQKAEYVACLNGSIPFDMLFSRPEVTTIIINKCSIPHINIKEIMVVNNINPVFINGYCEPVKGYPKTLGDGPFLLIFGDELKKYFQIHNWKYNVNNIQRKILVKYRLNCYKCGLIQNAKKVLHFLKH